MATTVDPMVREAPTEATFNTRQLVLNWEVIAYVVIFLLAMFTRFYDLGDRVMSHDESLHTVFSNNLYERGAFEHSPMMHGPVLFHFTALSYALFGVNDFSARIYTAVLGVAIVMFPLLLRRWLGRTGAVLASVMFLLSPLMLYYSRYIRHDMPSILSALIMFWAAMMYISGPPNQKRRAHWLYILAAAMLWNLGSKETAFIYVALFGLFLTLYWLARVAQNVYNLDGRPIFNTLIIAGSLAGVASLAMIVVFSIALQHQPTLTDRLNFLSEQTGLLFSGDAISVEFSTFLAWTGLVLVAVLGILIVPALWVYRRAAVRFNLLDGAMVVVAVLFVFVLQRAMASTTDLNANNEVVRVSTGAASLAVGFIVALSLILIYGTFRIERVVNFRRQFFTVVLLMLAIFVVLIVFEELSHEPSRMADETAAPAVPGEGGSAATDVSTNFTMLPLIGLWLFSIIAIFGVVWSKLRGWWRYLEPYPEFDVLMIMGSLILPWLTAFFMVATNATAQDYIEIGESLSWVSDVVPVTGAEETGHFVIGFIAWIPMIAMAVAAGLAWNWRRWLIASVIFHVLFAFFFTTMFTNIEGLATGMIHSLEYWLEQQGERRGSQPQYYYLLVIMPMYEFLPIIGSVLAMFAGLVVFWRRRRQYQEEQIVLKRELAAEVEVADDEAQHFHQDGDAANGSEPDSQIETLVHNAREREKWRLTEVPFLLFVGFWAVVNLYGYTLAGEKMPWLGTHMTTPMILLAGWYFGRVFERVSGRLFRSRGWVLLFVMPLLLVAAFQLVAPYLAGQAPFQGTRTSQIEWTYTWLAMAFLATGVLYFISTVAERTGWAHIRQMFAVTVFAVLAVITGRSAWMASFINYDEATEFLVYAHAAPANKTLTDQLRELSIQTTGGMDLRVLYDNKFSWPGSWYLRDFDRRLYIGENPPTLQQLDDTAALIVSDENRPKVEPLLEDRFQRFDHMRLWWPMQEYFGLSARKINDLFDFTNANSSMRLRGVFDIWWMRDYTTYGQAIDKSFGLTEWPVSDGMSLYVRKDIAAQVWNYGIGDASAVNPFNEVVVNMCTANWQPRAASIVLNTDTFPLVRPVGLDVGPDGRVYIAEEGTHRISIFSDDGRFLEAYGVQGSGEGAFFERPHSVAVGPDGDIFVADTWNFLIRRFDDQFREITSWGQANTAGFNAQMMPVDGFWGPRDVAVDSVGRVYVSDTGNKRIRVYESDGTFLRDIGTGGSGDGQLNEPAGIAVVGERLYVADTWNRRVAVFGLDGIYLYNFSVRGWYDELGNRPYLAVDPEREIIYVTDPDAGRILVHSLEGDCLGSFGQFGQPATDATQIGTVGGIALDDSGNVYVADLGNGRVLRFDPYEPVAMGAVDALADEIEVSQEVEAPETTAQVVE